MTINKEQPVSDALSRLTEIVGITLDRDFGFWSSPTNNERRSELFAAWKQARTTLDAASHPLEQQQAVSGDDLLERARHIQPKHSSPHVMKKLFNELIAEIEGQREDNDRFRMIANAEAEEVERLRAALTASGVERMRPLVERAMHELEDSDYPYHRSLGAEIRTALQEEGVERRD